MVCSQKPDVLLVDELSTPAEVEAVSAVVGRGVTVIAGIRHSSLCSLLEDNSLCRLVGAANLPQKSVRTPPVPSVLCIKGGVINPYIGPYLRPSTALTPHFLFRFNVHSFSHPPPASTPPSPFSPIYSFSHPPSGCCWQANPTCAPFGRLIELQSVER